LVCAAIDAEARRLLGSVVAGHAGRAAQQQQWPGAREGMAVFAGVWNRCRGSVIFCTTEQLRDLARDECERAFAKVCSFFLFSLYLENSLWGANYKNKRAALRGCWS
jgi:hypothetical protein